MSTFELQNIKISLKISYLKILVKSYPVRFTVALFRL